MIQWLAGLRIYFVGKDVRNHGHFMPAIELGIPEAN
jgi:hypothetical protein